MKILHTADWHLGHRLHENSQEKEQQHFLKWLKQLIIDHQIDLLLVAGDIFDSGFPSTQTQKMYYDFLVDLFKTTTCSSAIITGGNHDSPGTLNATQNLLDALSIKVVGKSTGNPEDEVFLLDIKGEKLMVAAVPYLRDQDIRRAVAGESYDDLTERYKRALIKHYHEVANYCLATNRHNAPIIAMGHLFAVGGSLSGSEQNIYVGNLGHIGANDFPKIFDYIALGHLHRAQLVGGNERIRYSGSPYILSFGEIHYPKQVIEITISNNIIQSIDQIEIPRFREIYSLTGTKKEVLAQFDLVTSNEYGLTPWVEIILDETEAVVTDDLKDEAAKRGFEILKISLKNFDRKLIGLEDQFQQSPDVKELDPVEVFRLKCQEQHIDLDKRPQLLDAYMEILHQVKKQ